jgi:flagellar hook-associated protein FlgK
MMKMSERYMSTAKVIPVIVPMFDTLADGGQEL